MTEFMSALTVGVDIAQLGVLAMIFMRLGSLRARQDSFKDIQQDILDRLRHVEGVQRDNH